MKDKQKAIGGKVRAEKLTEKERSNIASIAGKARWKKEAESPIIKATHKGEILIGDFSIPCAVLEDGTRVVSERGVRDVLGPSGGNSYAAKRASKEAGANMPVFLAQKKLTPFIDKVFEGAPTMQIKYKSGRNILNGFPAIVIPKICEVWLRARDAGALHPKQLSVALRAEILVRGLANIGIVSLIDEATGYQRDRDNDELHKILSIYLSEERLKWAKRFPDEFYKQIYRLKGWAWVNNGKRTPLIGKVTNSIVYDMLPPGVLEELRDKNPTTIGTGRRKWKHHQFLSEDIGQADLRDHLLQLIAIMRVSRNWSEFEENLERNSSTVDWS